MGLVTRVRRYEYEFERIELGGWPLANRAPKDDYRRIISERAEEGWRLVQIFAPSISVKAGGVPEWFELIFERPADRPLR